MNLCASGSTFFLKKRDINDKKAEHIVTSPEIESLNSRMPSLKKQDEI
jgi:hypothetical protein